MADKNGFDDIVPEQFGEQYRRIKDWYDNKGGREIIRKGAEEAREAGRALTESLKVDWRTLDEPMDY